MDSPTAGGSASTKVRKQAVSVSREPMTSQAARLIRASILNGEYKLGERLIEADLARRYAIGRHIVREALQILEGEQLVVSDAFRGRSVIQPTREDVEGIFLIRVALECVAAALAAYRITPEDSRLLQEKATVTPNVFSDLGEQDEWDASIHRETWRIAGEPMLAAYLERFISPAMKLAQETFSVRGGPSPSSEELAQIENDPNDFRGHQTLVRAICGQDPAAAREAMVAHLTGAKGSRDMRDLFNAAFGLP